MILHPIHMPLAGIDIPKEMNNPFDYNPHSLCIHVCKELQAYLAQRKDWREEIDKGKMFGVLIVETSQENQQIGYLAAYSGQIGGRSDWGDFVPAVFDYLQPDGYFKTHEAEITRINHSLQRLENDERMKKAEKLIASLEEERKRTIASYQEKMKAAKNKRDARRQEIRELLAENANSIGGKLSSAVDKDKLLQEEQAMIKESQFMKAEFRRLKKSLAEKTSLEREFDDYRENVARLRQLRKQLSDALQQWLFSQFRMLNYKGECKNLLEIFRDAAWTDNPQASLLSKRTAFKMVPPAGSGECCEPKLLQYAFKHHLKPLQMAMFWWGESPKEEIRHHLHFYPACNGKCKPILQWMLPDMKTAGNICPSDSLETLYEDEQLVVVCKPAGMLSVPGKDVSQTSVFSIMRKKYPEATGPLIVHRLDMATSGLMVIAKTEFAYRRLQEQFANHLVQKRYVAIVCCDNPTYCDNRKAKGHQMTGERMLELAKSGVKSVISLPLMPNYLDRPRQIVNHERGKEAITEYQVLGKQRKLEREGNKKYIHFRLALYPKTGRTHQLRVHCAHQEGLKAPILGDPLYGNEKASRLYLHAEAIRFRHPLTGKEIYIERKADF